MEDEQEEMKLKPDDFLLCEKCLQMSGQMINQNGFCMADIILGKRNIESWLPYVHENWSTTIKLYEIAPYDFRTFGTCEFSIFDHILLYKFWYKIMEQAYKRKLHEDLYKDLLDKNQVHLLYN
jgi:hypothetical protein